MLGSQSRVPKAAALLALIAIGTAGFRLIEGWAWFDAFYLTLYTVVTVDFSEPTGMSQYGRYFTVVLIIGGVGTVGYAVSLLTQFVIQRELQSRLEKRRLHRAIEKLAHNDIICGACRMGARVLAGDATAEEALLRAGVRRAKGIVCARPSDAENVSITRMSRDLCPGVYIVSRVTDGAAVPKMREAGAGKMVSIKRASGEMIFNPTGDARRGAGDKAIAVGTRASIEGLTRIAAPPRETLHR